MDEYADRARRAAERAIKLQAKLKRLEELIKTFEGCWLKCANDAEVFRMIETGDWR